MMDLLQRSNMEIHKVPCGEPPNLDRITTLSLNDLPPKASATHSSPNTDTSVVKVAMLSMKSQNWGRLCIPYEIALYDLVVYDRHWPPMPRVTPCTKHRSQLR